MIAVVILLLIATVAPLVLSTPLDDYVWKHDENYGWVDMVGLFLIRLCAFIVYYCF
jgi:uncharacterized membrane protein